MGHQNSVFFTSFSMLSKPIFSSVPHVFVHLFPIKYLDFLHRLPQGPSATLTCSASAWIGDSDFKFLIVKTVKIWLWINTYTYHF